MDKTRMETRQGMLSSFVTSYTLSSRRFVSLSLMSHSSQQSSVVQRIRPIERHEEGENLSTVVSSFLFVRNEYMTQHTVLASPLFQRNDTR